MIFFCRKLRLRIDEMRQLAAEFPSRGLRRLGG
jgi:hypothetical protein